MTAVAEVRGFRNVSSPSGGPLHVRDHPGDDVPMVVMHGFPDDLRIYDRLIPFLAPHRVIAFDWFGYGHSGRRGTQPFDPVDRQRDIAAVLDGLDLRRVILVAHDASGPEALEFASTHPERVERIVLLNTYYGRDDSLHVPEMIGLMADPEFRPLVDALMDDENQRLWLLLHTARRFGLDPGDTEGIGAVSVLPQFFGDADHPDALAEIRAWIADLPRALDEQDGRIVADRLSASEIPVSIIFGADDRFLNPDIARHLAGLFAHSDLHLVESASHWPQWDQPELVAKIMLEPPDPV